MVDFKLKQHATMVPEKNVQDVKVERIGNVISIRTIEGWMTINLDDETFAVGDYEG